MRLERPVSPHLAARLAGRPIDIDAAARRLVNAEPDSARWIVEGAGGVLVPVNDTANYGRPDRRLGLPVVVVARTALGTINHTLLTLEALRRRSIHVAGVVMVGEPNADNRDAIERYGRVAGARRDAAFEPLTPGALAAWAAAELDRDGRLARAAAMSLIDRDRALLWHPYTQMKTRRRRCRSCAARASISTPRTAGGCSTASRRGG